MSTHRFALSILMLLVLPCSAQADIFEGLDVSTGAGVTFGKVTSKEVTGEQRVFRIGAIPFVAILNRDLNERWTGQLHGQVLIDIPNQQMIRQGVAGALAYHVIGGARRLQRNGDLFKTTSSNAHNLSIVTRGGVFNYAAADSTNPKIRLTGRVWEVSSGFEYRRSWSEENSYGVSMLQSLITLPAGTERIASNTLETLFFWRLYL